MRTREEMFASKVSGNDQGFSWNEAAPMEISFYEPRMDVSGVSERKFVSPLADDAFFFYRFVFAGTLIEDGYLINKIEVIPRRNRIRSTGDISTLLKTAGESTARICC